MAQKSAILQILPALSTGGVEQACLDMLPAIAEAGFLPLVVSGGEAPAGIVKTHGGVHVAVPVGNKNPLVGFYALPRLGAVMAKYNVALLHAHSRMPAWLGYYAARRCGIPFVTSFHGAYNFKNFVKHRYNSIMARGARVLAVSEFIRSHILCHYGTYTSMAHIRVVYNGIERRRFDVNRMSDRDYATLRRRLGLPSGGRWIVMVARPSYLKGHALAVHSFKRLAAAYGDVNLLFIVPNEAGVSQLYSQFPYSQFPNRDAHADSWRERLYIRTLAGDSEDLLPAVYGFADICLNASTEPEAFGRTIIEGQLAGGIAVAANSGGGGELVRDGESGFLFRMNDAEDLCRTLGRALNLSAAERHRIAANGIKYGQKFGLENFRGRVMSAYEELL